MVDMCPRAPSLRRRLLQRRRGAWEVVQERMQIVVCIDDIWKMERMLGLWLMDGRCVSASSATPSWFWSIDDKHG